MKNLFIFIGISLFSFPVFANGQKNLIIGGQPVSANDPVAALTVAFINGKGICTGTIVDHDMMITAAHCVEGQKLDSMRVIFSRAVFKGVFTASVSGVAISPAWSGKDTEKTKNWGDIALVHFDGGLPSGYARAVIASGGILDGDEVVLAGYGITNARVKSGAGVLRKTQVTVKIADFSETEILMDQSQGRGACHGDSGGPAYIATGNRLELLGVTSRGFPATAPDDCKHYAVYTKVAPFLDWLSKAANKLREF